ncbi:glycoside hydrolase family 16 protein [Backusella circina FSU 941]|nr:glycoside hydrolase family 16 protein [Backusella circina FSU 941]
MKKSINPTSICSILLLLIKISLAAVDPSVAESVLYSPVPTNAMEKIPAYLPKFAATDNRVTCHNYRTDFSKSTRGWRVEDNLPYNEIGGRGPTLNASTYILYGKISATIRSASVGGAITAFIMIADEGDEIDFELLGGDTNHAYTNFFWGHHVEYLINGGKHEIPGNPIDTAFHKYTIDWQPEKIEWLIDDKLIRTQFKKDTCGRQGECRFPSKPARIQFGLWDGSYDSGTAQWARGPIDWTQHSSISAHVKELTVDCNPEYNHIVD